VTDTTIKVKRSKVKVTRPLCSPPCWRVRRLQRLSWERVGRGKLLLRCRLLGGARRFGAHGGRRGAGHIVAAARLQLIVFYSYEADDTTGYVYNISKKREKYNKTLRIKSYGE